MSVFKKIIVFVPILIMLVLASFYVLFINKKVVEEKFISSNSPRVTLYNNEFKEKNKIIRGNKVIVLKNNIIDGSKKYSKIKYNNLEYLIESKYLNLKSNIVLEKTMYVRTPVTVYDSYESSNIISYIKKGEEVQILSYDKLDKDGIVNRYKIKYNDLVGFVYGKYLVNDLNESKSVYNENNIQEYHSKIGNYLNAGSATELDYFQNKKPKFKNNIMPKEVRALYINASAIKNIDKYINFAKKNGINSFVVDIKDNTTPAYASKVMEEYSKTNYINAYSSFDEYKSYIKKIIDNGFYVIGRITTFKDSYYVFDNPSSAIKEVSNDSPYSHNGSYWPSAYNRKVWEFNVKLAKEAVTDIGFNEIQFDYVRFPDGIGSKEKSGIITLSNTYNETKSQAIQNFVMYACDEIHAIGAYVSIDVFGESAHDYVTSYGQYFPAISNVADVISAMPYPDHFNPHQYDIGEVVWTVPDKLLSKWGEFVVSKQQNTPTPAIVRTWLQVYDTHKNPSVVYDSNMVSKQISALYSLGLNGGFMTWNSSSNIDKYDFVKEALKKEY